MDPFSIVVGIAGLTTLVAQTVKITTKYISGVQQSSEAASALAKELEVLRSVLLRLDAFLHEKSSREPLSAMTDDSVLSQCTQACQSQLNALHAKLKKGRDKPIRAALTWPLKENEHRQTIQELRTLTQWIQIALTIDGCALLFTTSGEVMEILGGQLKCFQSVQEINIRTASVERSLEAHTNMLQTGHKAQERTVILEWISTQGYTNKHSTIRIPRIDKTGQWLLDHTTFRVWRDDIEPPNNVLWCHGNPGTGKSVLASLVIDHLQESSVGEDSATLFAYFDYRDQENQSSDSMTASLLQQIAAIHMDLPEAICNFYNKFKSNGIKPRLQDLEKALLLVCRNFERVFVVIDALDECEERQHRQTFMRVLQTLRNQPKVKLFITSRPHAQDIKTAFISASQIMIEAKDSDLRRYLSTKIENSDVVELIDEYFKIEIVNKVTDRANKMFLLPALQIQSILNEPTTGEMEDALQTMPRTLHEAFDETIARIRRQPEGRRRLAIHILMWLSHAKSPLTITELSEALAIRIGQPSLNRRYCPSQKLMIECCLGLVIVDEESSSVRLAHFSIQEYLKDQQTELFPSAEDEITEKCLTYLFLGPLSQGCCDLEENIFARLYDYPFLRYAASYWGHHLRRCETEQAVKLAISFLNSQPRIAMSTQICKFSKGLKEGYWVPREVNSVTGLHVASYFGLLHAARNILDSGDVEIDAQTQMGTTPLINAASAGFIDVVRFLLLKNANPRKANWYGTALHCAAEAGKCGAIRVLLDTDMAIDYRDAFGRTSLHCAVDMGHTRAARLLLDRGADPNAQDHDGETPIHYAKEQDCSEHVLPMLLEHVGNSSIKV